MIRKTDKVKKIDNSNKKVPSRYFIIDWCPRSESNRHGIATAGF